MVGSNCTNRMIPSPRDSSSFWSDESHPPKNEMISLPSISSLPKRMLSLPHYTRPCLCRMITLSRSSRTLQNTAMSLIYAGVAVVQATPFDGLRILLEQEHRALLPMRELCPIGGTTGPGGLGGSIEEIAEALTWLDGMSLMAIITRNVNGMVIPGGQRVAQLLSSLEQCLIPMLDEMLDDGDITHLLPRLHIHPALIPLTPGSPKKLSKTGYMPPYLVVFYANYDAAVNTFTDKWLPFSLFRAQNACVMAPRITAAHRIEQSFNPQTTTSGTISSVPEGMPEEYSYSRRPSKVQFDFPDSMPNMTPSSPTSTMVPTTPNHPVQGGMFGGFSFPPKADTPNPSPFAPVFTPPGSSLPRRSNNPSGPRRSSLAPRSRFESDAGDLGEKEGVHGVDEWDPDWLLVLLRTKLRAEL